ncbi:hypothetical protein Afil01_02700 [Actinorhabdospora filicis]|uniref:N-acetyltransferase domain-containing protein n=1 Tax=Actinorhabdospora filicis TaxID=1785913 RepID=A0A9W6SGA0_9ACTN|nr:GNAT family N-acetyltransferase [Actinorhabdospora filicis]GLZ75463.1 hypothetical protein Afil01_02700 [Actinorhabdospora filicis]
MEISTYTDDYELVAPLYGLSPERLREIDALHAERPPRLVAVDGGTPVGVVGGWVRPDGRLVGRFGGDPARTAAPLADRLAAMFGADVHTQVAEEDAPAFRAAGFRDLRAEDRYRVRFAEALDRLGERPVPGGYRLIGADSADPGRLLDLDCALRGRGWRPDPVWFREETFGSPFFDPSGYLVAVSGAGDYTGLARFWRNPDGPRLGFLAVLPEHRGRGVAAALLARAMRAAASWGHEEFVTEADPDTEGASLLARAGASRTGRSVELVRERVLLEAVAERHGPSYVAMIGECERIGEGYPWNNVPLARSDFAAFVRELQEEAAGIGLPEGAAAQRTYVLTRDGEVLGEFRLRPDIAEPFEEHNGHIGYNLRPSARGRGLGTRGLALVLDEARRLGVPGVLLTVEGANEESVRVILKNGGRLVRVFGDADDARVRSYWIDL